MLEKHTMGPAKGSRTKKIRIGRGHGSGKGKTAGRGHKGQRARSGGRNKLKLKGLKQMFLGFPKSRGFTSRYVKAEIIPLDRLLASVKAPRTLDLSALKKAKLVTKAAMSAKIVDAKDKALEPKIALKLVGVAVSAAVKEKIEKAGGSISLPAKKKAKPSKKSAGKRTGRGSK